ncbi:MAG: protein kinase, partial [Gemmatimonadaceae bacterium]
GMSRVFVAQQVALGRQVVIKVLPEELAGSVSVARFKREVSLAARLQHPHIVPLLATGQIGELPYYIMPFVEGDSLRARLSHGELPIAEVISILRDVAKALDYAHSKGVTHRDIKPDNVLLVGMSASITDFGVAKALSDAVVGEALTTVGVGLGTPAYMAPEQALADPTTDFRADLYAFGAMAYEMLAGFPPFGGRSMQSMVAAHATEVPRAIIALRPSTPPALAELVMRCLEKRPGDRPQSANEIVQTLDSIATSGRTAAATTNSISSSSTKESKSGISRAAVVIGAGILLCLQAWFMWSRPRPDSSASAVVQSIAILPFENTSKDSSIDYIEDGITDQVRDALSGMEKLTVKARSSSQQLKGHAVKEIGSKLDVGYVLSGTFAHGKSPLHVTAELVVAATGDVKWSGTYDGPTTALQEMQDAIMQAVIDTLHLKKPTPASRATASRLRGTTDSVAYDLFLRGRHEFDQLNLAVAIDLFQQAADHDPRFARAYGYLALAYANSTVLGLTSIDSMNALAQTNVARAMAIDSTLPEVYSAQASILLNEMRIAESIAPLERASKLDSTNTDILSAYASSLAQVGRLQEALAQIGRARKLDPVAAAPIGIQAYILSSGRQYDEALKTNRIGLKLYPEQNLMLQAQAYIFAFNGMPDSAVTAMQRAFKLDSLQFGGRSNLVFVYAAAGRWKDAARERVLMTKQSSNSPFYRQLVADLAFGDLEAAMAALEKSVAAKEAQASFHGLACDPLFDPLKSNPRFDKIMQRLGAKACPASGKWPIGAAPH